MSDPDRSRPLAPTVLGAQHRYFLKGFLTKIDDFWLPAAPGHAVTGSGAQNRYFCKRISINKSSIPEYSSICLGIQDTAFFSSIAFFSTLAGASFRDLENLIDDQDDQAASQAATTAGSSGATKAGSSGDAETNTETNMKTTGKTSAKTSAKTVKDGTPTLTEWPMPFCFLFLVLCQSVRV